MSAIDARFGRLDYAINNAGIGGGATRTAVVVAAESAAPELVQGLVAQHPMGHMATEDEIASAAVWLCSAGAGFVTGAPLYVDGGFLAA